MINIKLITYILLITILSTSYLHSQSNSKNEIGFAGINFGESLNSAINKIENKFNDISYDTSSFQEKRIEISDFKLKSQKINLAVYLYFDTKNRFVEYSIYTRNQIVTGDKIKQMLDYQNIKSFCINMIDVYSYKLGEPQFIKQIVYEDYNQDAVKDTIAYWTTNEINVQILLDKLSNDFEIKSYSKSVKRGKLLEQLRWEMWNARISVANLKFLRENWLDNVEDESENIFE